MPMRIKDSRIRSFTETLARETSPKIGDANVLDVLAAVGDGRHGSADQVKAALTKPGMSRDSF